MRGIVIAFYTPSYRPIVRKLIDSLDAIRVRYDVRLMPDRGEWELNCAQKPLFVKDMMRRNPGMPLLYVDADAVVHSDPWPAMPLIDTADIAVHYRRRATDDRGDRGELLSGTILINPTPGAERLMQLWCDAQTQIFKAVPTRDQRTWDQKVLSRCIDVEKSCRVARLGPEMTFIYDTMKRDHPDVTPVIEHFQHSRRIKAERANG